jgi:hypothetical protein
MISTIEVDSAVTMSGTVDTIDINLRADDRALYSSDSARRPAQPRTMDLREPLFSAVAFIIIQNKWNHEL